MAGWVLYNTYHNNQECRRSHILGGSISNNLKNEHNTYYYADVNNTSAQVKKFHVIGAEDSQIITDSVHARLPRRENYQKLKNELLHPGDTLVICGLSVLGSKYAARPELIYYRDHHIRVKILDMPATMQDFPEDPGNIYDTVTDAVIQTLNTVIKQEQLRIKRQQRRGIETLRESTAWEDYGRPAITLPDNYIEVMDRWLSGNITANAAMGLMGLRRTTFYKLAKLYKEGDLIV